MNERHVADQRFRGRQATRLGVQHVACRHVLPDVVDERQHMHVRQRRKLLGQKAVQPVVVAADDDHLILLALHAAQRIGKRLDLAKPHAAAHDEVHRLIRPESQPPSRLTRILAPRKLHRHRNAARVQPALVHAARDVLRNQVPMRRDVPVAVGLLPERNAGVVGRNGQYLLPKLAAPLEIGQRLGGIEVRDDDRVELVFRQIGAQVLAHEPVGPVDGRLPLRRAELQRRRIGHAKQPRNVLRGIDVSIADDARGALALEQHVVQHHGLVSLIFDALLHRARRRIVSLSRIAG